ncbi:hypothetical protein JTB14_027133 [Gonioctena quinquepunctata]|nr:hypothetical protein JTB14_027133 [Gonioctena quinquepunctata]
MTDYINQDQDPIDTIEPEDDSNSDDDTIRLSVIIDEIMKEESAAERKNSKWTKRVFQPDIFEAMDQEWIVGGRRNCEGYNDNKWKLLEKKSEILVRKRCNLYYSTGSFKIPGVVDSPAPCRSSRASSTEVFDSESLCLFCQKNWAKSSIAQYVKSADTDIVEKNNEGDDDNLVDLEHADEDMVESEYKVKLGYLQVIWGIFGEGSDDDVGHNDAETVRDADEQLEEMPTDQQPSTSDCQPPTKRRKRK